MNTNFMKNIRGKWQYVLTEKYKENLEMLKITFKEAHEFLKYIEGLENKHFHMGTAVNMHFYYKENFLFYFVFKLRGRGFGIPVKFSSDYNLQLKHDAPISSPELFFEPLIQMLKNSSNLGNGKIEVINNSDKDGKTRDRILVYPYEGCVEFFDMCCQVIKNIAETRK